MCTLFRRVCCFLYKVCQAGPIQINWSVIFQINKFTFQKKYFRYITINIDMYFSCFKMLNSKKWNSYLYNTFIRIFLLFAKKIIKWNNRPKANSLMELIFHPATKNKSWVMNRKNIKSYYNLILIISTMLMYIL